MARPVQNGSRRSPRSARFVQVAQSAALGLFMAGVAIAGIELSRWYPHGKPVSRSALPSASALHAHDLSHDQALVPVTPEPKLRDAPQDNSPGLPAVLPRQPLAASNAPHSASELFAAANRARVQGDVTSAIQLSQQLEATFPNSSEGITTHLSLGVLYLQQGQASLALQEFKTYRHIGASASMAEALWGEAQAMQQLGRASDERAALQELLQNYPRSAYAAAAQKRLATLD